jgi:chorismate mutase
MAVRAIRGAIQIDADDRSSVLQATAELVTKVMHANSLESADLISVWFTATPDVTSEFPAVAARELGLGDVPLMCSVEMDVAGAMPRIIRLMMHVETKTARSQIQHVYLRGAQALRKDLAQ